MDLAQHLQSCELELLDPATRSNPSRLQQLLDPDFLECGSSGRTFNRAQILAGLGTESPEGVILNLSDFHLLQATPEAALVTYRSHRHDAAGNHLRSSLRSSTWVLRNDRWQLLFHQGTQQSSIPST